MKIGLAKIMILAKNLQIAHTLRYRFNIGNLKILKSLRLGEFGGKASIKKQIECGASKLDASCIS